MTRKNLVLIVAAVLAVAGAVCCFVAGRYYVDNKKSNFTEDYVLYVYGNTTDVQVMDSLKANAGVVRPGSLKRCFDKMDVAGNIKPGRYVISTESPSTFTLPPRAALGLLTSSTFASKETRITLPT